MNNIRIYSSKSRFFTLLALIILTVLEAKSQTPTVQDCLGAISICQTSYSNSASYSGEGNYPDEINGSNSCLSGETNDVWYIFTVSQPGNVNFTITPNDLSDDYDWAVFNLSTKSCSDIYSDPSLQVSCNFSADAGATGPNGLGSSNNEGASGSAFNSTIPAQIGETYVINVSNYSSSQNGYTIDFAQSTAGVYDVTPSSISQIDFVNCNDKIISFNFSEFVECSTINKNDFSITGPDGLLVIDSIIGDNCNSGGNQEINYVLYLESPIITAGTYTVSINSNAGIVDLCGNDLLQDSIAFYISSPEPIQYSLTDSIIIDLGESINVNGQGLPSYNYNWTPTEGLSCTNCASPTATPTTNTTYNVLITDENGCIASDSIKIEVYHLYHFIPNIFSPNNDNLNDEIKVRGRDIKSISLQIFDRWGTQVFESTDVNKSWNGTLNGEELNQGVYIYFLSGEYANNDAFGPLKGHITLIR